MTLKNKSWLKNEVFRLYLSGYSQENIAKKLNISVGTVNNLVSEMVNSDDTIDLQRQIAIVAKKNGVNIMQIGANLRWKNEIKQTSLDDRKIEKFLDALDILFNKYSIPPSTAANQLFSTIELMLRNNIEPHRLEEEIKSKIIESKRLNDQIENRDKALAETKSRVEKEQAQLRIKEKNLEQFGSVSRVLELYKCPEISTEYGMVARAMIDFKRLGYDPKAIVAKYEASESLTKMNEKLEAKLQQSESILESYRSKEAELEAKWKDYGNAFEKFNGLVKDGLSSEDIFMAVHVIKNDFPKRDIHQLIEDIRTYGSVAAARWKLQRGYEAETQSMI
jgi:transcriptional regulator with XRE-family HTH domain